MRNFRPSVRAHRAPLVAFGFALALVGCKSTPPPSEDATRDPAAANVLPGIDAPLVELPMDKISCVNGPITSTNGRNTRRDCTYATPNGPRTIHVLTLEGKDFESNAYWHGRLLAKEIDQGSLNEALANLQKLPNFIPMKDEKKKAKLVKVLMSLYGCYERKMMKSTSKEFLDGVKRIYKGYSDGMGGKPSFSEEDFVRATYTIEMGNFFGGMMDRFQGGFGSKVSTGVDVLFGCGGAALKTMLKDEDVRAGFTAAATAMSRLKFACTGTVSPAGMNTDGKLLHARNLEQTAMINTWNDHATIFIMNEANRKHKYVAFGTAGLAFPGGISGMNDAGISVSLHQMSTTAVDSSWKEGSAAMLPFLQQRILREAGSIDDAIKIVENTHAFSSWAILISDGVRQEVASIEVSADGTAVARRRKNDVMGQSNMFLAKKMQKLNLQHRYNNLLESYARVQTTESELRRAKRMDLGKTINLLANHKDFFEPTGERAFGRGVARVSNIMTSIVEPKTDGTGGKVWMTVGDQLPPNHGYYAGFDVDFASMSLVPNGAVKSGTYAARPNYERSFERYHQAYIAHNKPEVAGSHATEIRLIDEAIALAAKDGVDEPTYKYIRARTLLNDGNASAAYAAFLELSSAKYEFHPLRKANISMYLMRASDLIGGGRMSAGERSDIYEAAKKVVDDIEDADPKFHPVYPDVHGYVHGKHDLESKAKMWKKIFEGKLEKRDDGKRVLQAVKLQDVDMSTVD